MKNFTFKLRKEHIDLKEKIYQIIGDINIVDDKASLEGDLLITLKFESFDQKTEFNKEMIKAGLPFGELSLEN